MKSYIFPGQGSQFPGMCHDLYQKYTVLKEMFTNAEEAITWLADAGFVIKKSSIISSEKSNSNRRC